MGDIRNKKVFSEKVESFVSVVDALITDQKTREMYDKDPLLALKKHGIEFKDEKIAIKVREQLLIKPEELLELNIPNPNTTPRIIPTGPYVLIHVIALTNSVDFDELQKSLRVNKDIVQEFLTPMR